MRFTTSLPGALMAALFLIPRLVSGQLSGNVGPITSLASKAAKKTCNVLDYGAKADKKTDLGPALSKAWTACKSGGVVIVPEGDFAMSTWQTLRGGSGWAVQLDGTIYRTGTAGGHMIIVQGTDDFEFFSSTSQGAMQGYGYKFHAQNTYGPRLIRLVKVTNWSFHDIKLVDSPAFHIIFDNCSNGEMYNTIIRGGNRGGLDGVDVSGNNIWIHDVSVTNKDECITIKTPAKDMLIEQIYCNWSGGSAIGSLGENTAIETIEYKNIYTWSSNQMMMIKSNGGSGYVKNCTFSNFIGHNNAYALNLNANWAQRALAAGNGVEYSNLRFSNWQATIVTASRPPINFDCPSGQPCTDIALSNLTFAPVSGSTMKYTCNNAYGTGYCLKTGSSGAYSSTTSVKVPTSGFDGPKMSGDLPAGLGLTVSIDIPAAIPTLFYPDLNPIKPLMGGGTLPSSASTSIVPTSTSSKTTLLSTSTASVQSTTQSLPLTSVLPTSFVTSSSSTVLSYAAPSSTVAAAKCAQRYWQCGGLGWKGATCCESGSECKALNHWYSQCTPSS